MADEIQGYLDRKLVESLDRREFLQLGLTVAGAAAFVACGGSPTSGPSGPTGPPVCVRRAPKGV